MKKKTKKKKKPELSTVVTFRVNKSQYSKIKALAKMYADGQISTWIRHCLTDYTPKMMGKRV